MGVFRRSTLGADGQLAAWLDVWTDGTVRWNTGGMDSAKVYVSQDGGARQLVFFDPAGVHAVDWMRPGSVYRWTLYGVNGGMESPNPLSIADITAASAPASSTSASLPAAVPVNVAPWWPTGSAVTVTRDDTSGRSIMPPAISSADPLSFLDSLPGGRYAWIAGGAVGALMLFRRK